MRLIRLFLSGIVFALLLNACANHAASERNKLADKCAPFEFFAFQRSFPDRDFDWQGWRKVLHQAGADAAVQARNLEDCGGNQALWTEQGPSNVGARCNTLAAKPDDENTVLAGFSGGGIFKTTDGGVNWRPVFDDHIELSIGDITFDPNNPNIVYVGTGDPNVPAIPYNGNGIYKSTDAGETWTHLGLSTQGVISKVVINPNNSQQLWVATMGKPYARDNERGIYMSKDGGNTWQHVLFVSNQAGASDLVMSPVNPNILYASFWDRIRNNQESVIYGPNAKIFKSTDGGETWTQLGGGLPTGTLGRTGLAISQTNPNKVYAVFIDSLSTPHSLHKTTDGGLSWTPVNIGSLEDACGDFGWYFGKIRVNPTNDEDVYFLAILLWRKAAGSNSWLSAGGGHADSHDLIFLPSGRRFWANDGGVYRNDPNQMFWTKCKNLPVTQFYHTTYNPHEPHLYWGGTQDNGVQKGAGGPSINNWSSVFSADGFRCAFDPNDPQTFWVEIQNGTIHKTTDGGSTWQFGTAALGTSDRCNWDAPFFMSKFNSSKLYAATYRAYISSGSGWGSISPDLTDGIVFAPRFHTVSCLNESPVMADKLIAGTSDGNVWRREPNGSWIKINGTLPDRYVTSVHGSPTLSNRLFVTHSGFRDDEYIPHVHRSDDNGASWKDISNDLPQVPVNDLFVLPNHGDSVLFVGTDAGVYVSRNSGLNWTRLGSNMPVIPVFDLEENPVKKELVAATFARGIWTMPFDSILAEQPPVTVSLGGMVQTELGEGVSNVSFGSVKSLASGLYQIPQAPGCDVFTLNPQRNDNLLNGITTFDLVLISKHILGIESLNSPYKMMAADANRSNSITTSDIVAIRKLILGIDTVLAGNTSWRFVPQSHQFTNPVNPLMSPIPDKIEVQTTSGPMGGLNFIGVKVGDVNNTVAPNNAGMTDERKAGIWGLQAPDTAFVAGELVELVLPAQSLAALQFTLQFDRSKLQFERLELLSSSISAEHFNLRRVDQGLISCAFEAGSEEVYFKLIFRALGAGRLSQFIGLANQPTPSLAYDRTGQVFTPALWTVEPELEVTLSPNPFGASGLNARISGSTAGEPAGIYELEVYNQQGVRIFAQPLRVNSAISIDAAQFPESGVYYWRVKALGKQGKVVFMR